MLAFQNIYAFVTKLHLSTAFEFNSSNLSNSVSSSALKRTESQYSLVGSKITLNKYKRHNLILIC